MPELMLALCIVSLHVLVSCGTGCSPVFCGACLAPADCEASESCLRASAHGHVVCDPVGTLAKTRPQKSALVPPRGGTAPQDAGPVRRGPPVERQPATPLETQSAVRLC